MSDMPELPRNRDQIFYGVQMYREAQMHEYARQYAAQEVAKETDRCCSLVYSHCDSDNVAQRTVDAIRARSGEIK